jgi:hypothetical protein
MVAVFLSTPNEVGDLLLYRAKSSNAADLLPYSRFKIQGSKFKAKVQFYFFHLTF